MPLPLCVYDPWCDHRLRRPPPVFEHWIPQVPEPRLNFHREESRVVYLCVFVCVCVCVCLRARVCGAALCLDFALLARF